jgi:hypothetical protein
LVVWPSGPRRTLQARVRKGVGSNPTATIFIVHTLSSFSFLSLSSLNYRFSSPFFLRYFLTQNSLSPPRPYGLPHSLDCASDNRQSGPGKLAAEPPHASANGTGNGAHRTAIVAPLRVTAPDRGLPVAPLCLRGSHSQRLSFRAQKDICRRAWRMLLPFHAFQFTVVSTWEQKSESRSLFHLRLSALSPIYSIVKYRPSGRGRSGGRSGGDWAYDIECRWRDAGQNLRESLARASSIGSVNTLAPWKRLRRE